MDQIAVKFGHHWFWGRFRAVREYGDERGANHPEVQACLCSTAAGHPTSEPADALDAKGAWGMLCCSLPQRTCCLLMPLAPGGAHLALVLNADNLHPVHEDAVLRPVPIGRVC